MGTLVRKEANDAIDALEAALLAKFTPIDCPLNHSFGPGIYMREVFMPAGSKIVSKEHKFRHPYFVMKGSARVWIDGKGVETITAPHVGWTEPGTRRVLEILTDMFWITCHANPDDTQDLEIIEERIIEKHTNELLETPINHDQKFIHK
jgi:quercetin dioxygenase-like cupin family protein